MPEIKIAVISDLHCRVSTIGNGTVTRLYSDQAARPALKHPIYALTQLIRDTENLSVDIILCPGDIADKADDQGLISGYGFLKELQAEFKAGYLLTTVGNHDVKSRSTGDLPFDFLQNFDQNYPLAHEQSNQEFWLNRFTLVSTDKVDCLIFNSCYTHIDAARAGACTIDAAILEAIEARIRDLAPNRIKIAMCHHHPLLHGSANFRDTDVMNGGDQLLNLLSKYQFNFLVHGHKHDPRLTIHNNLPVLASGSFSSRENLLDSGADNVFHLVTINDNPNQGTIDTYIYKPGKGWHLSSGTYFPTHTGFGSQNTTDVLVEQVSTSLRDPNLNHINFMDLVEKVPDLKYLSPTQQEELQRQLKNNHGLEFLPPLQDGSKVLLRMI
jgi:DNA repair exonuclease SbcCD nuclease subunit